MNKRHFATWVAGAAVLSLLVTGCGANQSPESSSGQDQKQEQTAAKTTYPLTYKDATGQEITIKEEPKRIVSLLPSSTEILFALGLGDKVVGVSKWDDYPAEAKQKPVIGDMKPNAEAVVAQQPDLVIGGASSQGKDIDALRGMGLNVIALEPKTISEVEAVIRDVGTITNTLEQADQVVAGMEKKLQRVKDKVKALKDDQKPRTYVEISPAPNIFTAGKGTFMDEMIVLAGGTNIAADQQSWAKISPEQVVASNPQVIISTHGVQTEVAPEIAGRAGWSGLDAVKNKRIVAVDTNLVSRPGPRIAEGLEQFFLAIHPELYN